MGYINREALYRVCACVRVREEEGWRQSELIEDLFNSLKSIFFITENMKSCFCHTIKQLLQNKMR